MVVRLHPNKRKERILDVAVELAKLQGYRDITREEVAMAANVSPGLINVYFGSIGELRSQVLARAIKLEIPEIIAQRLAVSDTKAPLISKELRQKAADFVRNNNAKNTPGI